MFSGIVKGTGRIIQQSETGGDRHLTIGFAAAGLEPPSLGASIAVNGVCLTATACLDDRFEADVSAETLAVTTLGELRAGAHVNLEASLRLGDHMDGHWVSGHVDGVGHVVSVEPAARSTRLSVELPKGLARYVARKGSIAVDGTSLTVNSVRGAIFEVNVIPLTLKLTVISGYRPGTAVNIEVDIIARYLERLVSVQGSELDLAFLRTHGYTSEQ